ncbi:MAG: hypothetical protein SVV67_10055 [Bacillota bacterium]|nr:hypothetical protein [Bacillota bacterium]
MLIKMKPLLYQGQFKGGYFHGRGTMIWADGTVIEGTWENEEFVN